MSGATTAVAYEQQTELIKDKTRGYWTKRADSFSETRHEELHSEQATYWRTEIAMNLQLKKGMRILDVGCGAGYFEAILAPFGCRITGVDLTPEMIAQGKALLERHHIDAELLVMDAENLEFPDESFDAVITRNLTWNLPRPDKAYKEWHRVLKTGGVLLNFDAEYAKNVYRCDQSLNKAHETLSQTTLDECSMLYRMLAVSTVDRPDWDAQVLAQIGFTDIVTDTSVSDRIFPVENQFYIPDPMFSIRAVK